MIDTLIMSQVDPFQLILLGKIPDISTNFAEHMASKRDRDGLETPDYLYIPCREVLGNFKKINIKDINKQIYKKYF